MQTIRVRDLPSGRKLILTENRAAYPHRPYQVTLLFGPEPFKPVAGPAAYPEAVRAFDSYQEAD